MNKVDVSENFKTIYYTYDRSCGYALLFNKMKYFETFLSCLVSHSGARFLNRLLATKLIIAILVRIPLIDVFSLNLLWFNSINM